MGIGGIEEWDEEEEIIKPVYDEREAKKRRMA